MAKKKEESAAQANVSQEEQIGFHKGALSTLAKEREEMLKRFSESMVHLRKRIRKSILSK